MLIWTEQVTGAQGSRVGPLLLLARQLGDSDKWRWSVGDDKRLMDFGEEATEDDAKAAAVLAARRILVQWVDELYVPPEESAKDGWGW